MTIDLAGVCTGPGPCDVHPTGHGGDNFVTRGGGFDPYLRAIINALKRKGHPESQAVQIAIGTVQRWARGEGNVTAETRARAAASLAHWEALKAKAHVKLTAAPVRTVDLAADAGHVYHWRHGWVPITPHAALQKAHGSHAGAARILHVNGQHADAHAMLQAGYTHHAQLGNVKAAARYKQTLNNTATTHVPSAAEHSPAEIARGYDIHGNAVPRVDIPSARTQGIEIAHSGDGTLVHGTSRTDGSAAVLKQHGFRWSSNLGAWYLPRNQHFSTRSMKVDHAERDLKAAGHDVTVTREAARATTAAEREAEQRSRAADRAERMGTRAERASTAAQSHFDRAHQIGDMIPMGQPILVGHHSEGRHRRDLQRIDTSMRRGVEANQEARAAERSAENARRTAAGDSPLLRQRRIDRNEAEIRKIDKSLAQHEIAVKKPEAAARFGIHPSSDAHLAQLRASRAELADQVAHDKAQIAASGHKAVTAADIKAGDTIHYRGRTHVVKKVNKTTVSVPTGYSWDDKVPINQITRVVKPDASLTAAPSSTLDLAMPVVATTDGPNLTVPAGTRHYRHGWVRIDAAGPSAVERATRAVATDGHALLHGAGMVPAAQKVVERAKAAGHRVTVSRVDVRGTPHLHVARRGTDLTAGPTQTVDLAFTEALHPRGAKGSSSGGKFVAKNSTSSPAKSSSSGGGGGLPANVAANVRDFQRRNHLPVTGVIDQATAAKIRAAQTPKAGGKGKGKSAAKTKARKAAAAARRAAKAAARAKKQQTAQHVATVNTMTPAQRASARAAVPVPPTGYVWTPTNTLRRYP